MPMDSNKIITELCWRLEDGTPDFSNPEHLQELKVVLTMHKWTTPAINELIENLTITEIDFSDQADFAKYSSKHKMRPTTKVTIGGKDTTAGEAGEAEPKDDSKDKNEPTPSELSAVDHKTADAQVMMTKAEAKAQAKQPGFKDVGAGTAESRAGEAMVHKGLRMIKDGKSIEEIEKSFTDIANSKESILNSKSGKQWVKAAIAGIKKIDEQFGIENVKEVSWDTSSGRKAIGVDPNLKTSSDMFIQLKDETVAGISLKKDGNVFISNGGWATQSKALIDSLGEGIPPKDKKILESAMSIESYKKDLNNRASEAIKSSNLDELESSVTKLESHPDFDKYFGGAAGPKYLEALSDLPALQKRLEDGTVKSTDMKAFAKLLQITKDPKYDNLRAADHELTSRTFKALNESAPASKAMKNHIIKSMHIMDTLGLNETLTSGGVDNFTTVYGIPPDGAVLNEESLVSLIGPEFADTLSKVRSGKSSKENLETLIASQINMDYTTGEIIFTHETGRKHPIFTMKGRSKSLGASPTMEIAQTTHMAHALKNGSFNVDDWDKKEKAKYYKSIADED